ncbi:MAG: hypothetical protein Q4B68_07710 [Bacteroidales bacterium]|nr:hypothetical protein [Bacteroidales bacterium]
MEFYYVSHDLFGNPYNSEFPPNAKEYGTKFGGYKNANREVLFYDFAIVHYDVQFDYAGTRYYLLIEPTHAARCDENFTEEYEVFTDPNTLIKNLIINGHKLLDIIDDLENIEPM